MLLCVSLLSQLCQLMMMEAGGGGGCLAMPQFPPYDLLVRQNNFVQEVCR